MPEVTVQEISTEQQWCAELRRILGKKKKPVFGDSDEKKLGDADVYARDQLKKLNSLSPEIFKKLGGKYKSLSENSRIVAGQQ